MPSITDTETSARQQHALFTTTHWSVVLAAKDTSSPTAQQALELLCKTYRYPLYAYVRRAGYSQEDAADRTQEFLFRFIHANALSGVQHEKGKFRSFLLACLKNFLSTEWRKATAQKRGGGESVISLDEVQAEDWYQAEQRDTSDPQMLFDRRWAIAVLDQTRLLLRQEYMKTGKTPLLEALEGCLPGAGKLRPYTDLAKELQCPQSTIKSYVHRIRTRFAELLRQTVKETVSSESELEEELRYLRRVLSIEIP
jgi:RNA polymerase sigma-70 factor (ECF subfamily)